MEKSDTVILTDGKTVEKPYVARNTYAEVVAEGSTQKQNFCSMKMQNKKNSLRE